MLVYTLHLSYEEKKIDRSSWSPTECIIVHKKRKDNDSGRTRTYDRLLRRQLLYPTELLSQREAETVCRFSYRVCLSVRGLRSPLDSDIIEYSIPFVNQKQRLPDLESLHQNQLLCLPQELVLVLVV